MAKNPGFSISLSVFKLAFCPCAHLILFLKSSLFPQTLSSSSYHFFLISFLPHIFSSSSCVICFCSYPFFVSSYPLFHLPRIFSFSLCPPFSASPYSLSFSCPLFFFLVTPFFLISSLLPRFFSSSFSCPLFFLKYFLVPHILSSPSFPFSHLNE